ncbi:MAG: EAL domain-containing protein [Chloroflexi bacterium]|nr:EAL domain-containing protein [Chloroflexota bacterium]MDA1146862.1 EAL domain-containing protein [Chloroflexota bacterium]
MHDRLARQLRALGIEPESARPPASDLAALLAEVDEAYVAADEERAGLLRELSRAAEQMRLLYVEQQQATEQRYEELFENAHDIIVTIGLDGAVTSANRACERLTGYTRTELIGRQWRSLVARDDQGVADEMFARQFGLDDGELRYELRMATRRGRRVPIEVISRPLVSNGNPYEVLAVGRDVSERLEHERHLQRMATHDMLTGLANRSLLEEELFTAVASAARGQQAALMLIDVDNFKAVNDTLGHGAGDQVLVVVAGLLRRSTPGALVARLSADEFAVLMRNRTVDEALTSAERFRNALQQTDLSVEGKLWYLSASVGVATIDATSTVTGVLAEADAAMQAAKQQGRNRVIWSGTLETDRTPHDSAHRQASLVRNALSDDRVEVYYQPIVDLATSEVSHHEVLARIRMANGELAQPGLFMAAAEQFGLIAQLDARVARIALERLRREPDLRLFINLSSLSLRDQQLFADLATTLAQEPALGAQLGIEITETAAVQEIGLAQRWIEMLRGYGCRVALDDFGTGFNSLTLVKELPVTEIKIDGSFVRSIATDPHQRAVVAAIKVLADGLGMETVAEQIETAEQLAIVRELGITYGQGFLLGRPVPCEPPADAAAA